MSLDRNTRIKFESNLERVERMIYSLENNVMLTDVDPFDPSLLCRALSCSRCPIKRYSFAGTRICGHYGSDDPTAIIDLRTDACHDKDCDLNMFCLRIYRRTLILALNEDKEKSEVTECQSTHSDTT